MDNEFICPECGSKEAGEHMMVSKEPLTEKNNNKIQCLCDCNAGRSKMHCKHWMGVFEGKKQEYIGISKEQLDELKSWLLGSDVEQAWNDYQKIKEKEDDLKKTNCFRKKENNEKITKSDVGYLNEKTISIHLSGFDVLQSYLC